MRRIGPRTRNLLLGTATPIQTEVQELWDLLGILNAGAEFVLGRDHFSSWKDVKKALPVVKGEEVPADDRAAWDWLRNPLPPAEEHDLFQRLRLSMHLPERTWYSERGFGSLG